MSITGIGLGFRSDLASELLETQPDCVDWLEIHPENYVARGGYYASILKKARDRWPLITHGLTLCLGSPERFEQAYLKELRGFLSNIATPWHSEHLCFGGLNSNYVHDLLPLPFTEEAIKTAVQRIAEAHDGIDLPLAIENVSYYAAQSDDGLDEALFLKEIAEQADAKLLLDVNNVYVNSKNFGFDPKAFIDRVPIERVVQLHVAGHYLRDDGLRIDTHGESICEGVHELLEYTLNKTGPLPVLLERDSNIPVLPELITELKKLKEIYQRATADSHAA